MTCSPRPGSAGLVGGWGIRVTVQTARRVAGCARYDADQTVTALAARLKDPVDLDAVRDDLFGVVHQALEPTHLSVWISQHN